MEEFVAIECSHADVLSPLLALLLRSPGLAELGGGGGEDGEDGEDGEGIAFVTLLSDWLCGRREKTGVGVAVFRSDAVSDEVCAD